MTATATPRTVEAHEAEIERLKAELAATRGRIRSLAGIGRTALASWGAAANDGLGSNLLALTRWDEANTAPEQAPWVPQRWTAWEPGSTAFAEARVVDELRIGSFRDRRSGDLLPISTVVPFIGSDQAYVLLSHGPEQAARAANLMQSLVVRTAAMFPQQARYTLLDPAGNGLAFPMARYLPRVSPSSGDVRRDLDQVTQEIQRVISTYLDASTTSFEQIPDEMRLNEAFHFVFAADYPNRYDLRAAEALQAIARTGPRAGVYLFVHVNVDQYQQGIGDYDRYAIENRVVLDLAGSTAPLHGLDTDIVHDAAPGPELQQLIFDRIKAAPPLDRPIPWDEVNPLPEGDWWQGSSDHLISAPIGRHGANQPLTVWFGNDERDNRPCVHGILGATTGAGKSTLFHNLIVSMAVRYSPEELRFFLIDGKFGVEFQPYQELPHAEVVSLRTSPDLSRSVLADLVEEMGRRNAVFVRQGVADLTAYRAKGQPEGIIPRTLLVVDEYQQLFDGDKDGEASAALLRLSQQGRSVGIHMLLASQRFDTAGMLHRTDIFGNVHLRLAMQMAHADIAALTDFGQRGRRLIAATCDRAGRVVVNDRAGDDEANVAGKTAYLHDDRRDEVVRKLQERAASLHPTSLPRKVIFNGQAQPDVAQNPLLAAMASRQWQSGSELESFARKDPEHGGLGVADWLAPERPVALFLGQEFNVRGHAMAVLRRRPNEHLCLVADRPTERTAMLATAIVGAAASTADGGLRVVINDRSVLRTDWADVLERSAGMLGAAGIPTEFTRSEDEATWLIQELASEVERRRSLPEEDRIDEPTILVVLNEPDRVTGLQRIPDEYGSTDSPLGLQLRTVVSQGSSVGVHLLLGISSLGAGRSILADGIIQSEFRHRVALQMSEDDAFVFVRSSRAAKLQADGERPIAGLVFDNQLQRDVKFKPYSIEPAPDAPGAAPGFLDQLASVATTIGARRS